MSLLNLQLEIIYCSTTLSNHGLIGLKDCLEITPGGYGMSFVSYPHLRPLINGQTFEITVVSQFLGN